MNKNEMQHMLSLVDEVYIQELCNSEELTTEAIPVHTSRRHIITWAAAAAVFCLCLAGGSRLLHSHTSQLRTGTEYVESTPEDTVSTAVSETDTADFGDYFLIWGDTSHMEVCRYNLFDDDDSMALSNVSLNMDTSEFDISQGNVSIKNEKAVIADIRLENSTASQTLTILIDDGGFLYPNYFIVDLSGDDAKGKPVFHIYDASFMLDGQSYYQIYFVSGGIGYSINAVGYTADEAIAYAAEVLHSGMTADSFYTDNIGNEDYSIYFKRETPVIVSADFSLSDGSETVTQVIDHDFPFDISPFTTSAMQLHLRSDGSPVNAYIHMQNEQGQNSDIYISSMGLMFAHNQMQEKGGIKRNGVMLFGERLNEERPDEGILSFRINGVDCYIVSYGLSDKEIILLADELINCIRSLTMDTPFSDFSDYFKESTPRGTAMDVLDMGGKNYQLTNPALPLNTARFASVQAEIFCFPEGLPENAKLHFTNDTQEVMLVLTGDGAPYGAYEINFDTDGMRRNGIMLYGYHTDQDTTVLYFSANGIGYSMTCSGITDEDIILFADEIIESGLVPQSSALSDTVS